MSKENSLAQLQELIDEAETLRIEIMRILMVTTDPLEKRRLERQLADNRRNIEQYKALQEEVEAQPEKEIPKIRQQVSNPFNRLGVVGAEYFMGREVKLRRIKKAINDGNSIILIGPPKIGKSSFMHRLYESYSGQGWHTIFFDFMEPISIQEHYAHLTKKLDAAGNTYQDVKAAIEGKSVILFLDELDLASVRGLDSDQLGGFQSLARSNDFKFRVIAASTRPAHEIFATSEFRSLPYAFLRPEPLTGFTREECLGLLKKYLSNKPELFSPQLQEQLLELSQNHPFKLMRAACRVYEALVDPEAGEDWQEAYKFDISNMMQELK